MNIINLAEVDSTNSYAKSNLGILEDRSVVCAIKQTAGRGRFDRKWVDLGDGNLFFSIVLKPSNLYSDKFSNLTQYMSVALCHVFEDYGICPSIKWPNDVLIDGKKISGILSETVVKGSDFKGLILGVGVNLNADISDLDKVTDKEITALNLELGVESIDKEKFFNDLIEKFFATYDDFLREGFQIIKDYYVEKSMFLGKEISVKVFNEEKCGLAKEISNSGELILLNNNEEIVLTMGDIL